MAITTEIKRIYVRRYSDSGQVVAYAEYVNGSRTEAPIRRIDVGRGRWFMVTGTHMHAIFARAKRAGLRLERETW